MTRTSSITLLCSDAFIIHSYHVVACSKPTSSEIGVGAGRASTRSTVQVALRTPSGLRRHQSEVGCSGEASCIHRVAPTTQKRRLNFVPSRHMVVYVSASLCTLCVFASLSSESWVGRKAWHIKSDPFSARFSFKKRFREGNSCSGLKNPRNKMSY